MASGMAQQLGPHELQHIFSFLEARDLLCAAQVNKVRSRAGVAPPPRSASLGVKGHLLQGIGLADGLQWHRPTLSPPP